MKQFLLLNTLIIIVLVININTGNAQKSPGGVDVSSLKAWFKVENYSSGSNSWDNSADNPGLKQVFTNNAPDYMSADAQWNYNPSLKFNGKGGNNGFRASVLNKTDVLHQNQGTIISIYTGANNNSINDGGVFGYRSDGFYKNELSILNKSSWFRGEMTNGTSLVWTQPIEGTPSMRTFQFANKNHFFGADVHLNTFNNSLLDQSNKFYVTTAAGKFSNFGNKYFGIGEIPNAHYYNGSIGEVIVFASDISSEELNRIDSYLAIKYGQTLGSSTNTVNYRSSNGTIIWTRDKEYQNNIIGIGKDNTSDLLQKQSHQMDDSVRVYLNKVETTNIANSGSFSKDRSFVIVGSNTVVLNATDYSNLEMMSGQGNCDLFSRIEREWKIQRTNMTEKFNMDIKLSTSATTPNIDPAQLRVIIDNDGDFSNGGTVCYFNGDNSGIHITYVNGVLTIEGLSTQHIANNSTQYMTIASVNSTTPLPVGLTSFTAGCNRNSIEMVWETETETNNDYFTVEKSIDGLNFESFNILKGNGSKSTPSIYQISDLNRIWGITYYRLSQTDFDRKATIIKTISSNCNSDSGVIFHPNPTKEGVYVTLSSGIEESFEIAVYSMLGKLISTHNIDGSTWIPLPNTSGLYMLKYKINDVEKVEKIVKY